MENNENGTFKRYTERDISDLKGDVKALRKSYAILNDHSADVVSEMKEIKTDVAWLKRFFWIIATATIGSLIGTLIQIIKG